VIFEASCLKSEGVCKTTVEMQHGYNTVVTTAGGMRHLETLAEIHAVTSKFFIPQLMHQWIVLKTILKFTLKLIYIVTGIKPAVTFDFCLTVHHQFGKVILMNQLDATMIYWSTRSAQHVSGNILPIIRSVRLRYLQHMVSCTDGYTESYVVSYVICCNNC